MPGLRQGFMFLLCDLMLGSGCQFKIGALVDGGAAIDLSVRSDLSGITDGAIADVAPVVISNGPLNGAITVAVGKKATATFDKAMDPSTITALTFTLKQGTTLVSGAVAFDDTSNTATFTPLAPLGPGLVYDATVTTGAQDAAHTAIVANYDWTFTTGACSQAAVALGSAATFAVLASTTVTNTGMTTIMGDLGLSPGTSVTGAPNVIGALHVADATAAKALVDLTTAYDDAAKRTLCAVTLTGDIGGQTVRPGLYKSASSLAIASGNLTLDALDDSDAVFIFQMATSLTIAAGNKVVLTRGARAANVFWQVGTAPSFAATTDFKGTLMAHDAVSLGNLATLNQGRAMSVTAAVNLDTNTIVRPAL